MTGTVSSTSNDSTVTTTVVPVPGGGMVETVERHEEYSAPTPEPIVVEATPEMLDLDPIASQIAALSEQITALQSRVDDLTVLPSSPPAPAVALPPESLEDEEDILELEDATELPETSAKETKITASDEVKAEKPKPKKHAGFFF